MSRKRILFLLIATLGLAASASAQDEPEAECDCPPGKPVCILAAELSVCRNELAADLSVCRDELAADLSVCRHEEDTAPCCDDLQCDENPLQGWYALGEFLYLTRDNQSINQPVVVDNSGNTLLTTHDLQFGYEPGARVLIGKEMGECGCCSAWELSYFGLFDWNASRTLTGDNDLNVAGELGFGVVNALTLAERMRVSYSADLHNIELNCVKTLRCCETCCGSGRLDLLLGVRYLTLNEDFNIFGENENVGTGFYNTHSTNNLFGAQLGARLRRTSGDWGWEATAKAGIFGNAASQHQVVEDIGGFSVRDARSSGGNVAFVGDLNLSLLRRLNDTWMLRGGYNVFWIDGVALAPDQLDFSNTPDSGTALNSAGGVLAHGASLGLEAHW